MVAPGFNRWFRCWVLAWVGALLWLAVPARAAELAAFALTGAEDGTLVVQNAQMLEDPGRTLSLADARTRALPWQAAPADAISPGFARSVWWVRVRIANPSAQARLTYFDLGTALQDHVHFFVLQPDGTQVFEARTGDRTPFRTRPLAHHSLVLPLNVAAGAALDVYLRLDTHDGLFEAMPLSLSTPENFAQRTTRETLVMGMYYGALVALAIYNLFLFLSTRGLGFGYYVAYLASFLMWGVIYRGYALQYLWPDSPRLNNVALCLAAGGAAFSFGMFAIAYLRMRRRLSPPVLKFSHVLIGLYVVPITLAAADWYALSWAVTIPLGVVTMAWSIIISVRFLRLGHREARFFVPAFFLVGVGVAASYALILGVAPVNLLTIYALQIGSFAEVVLLAFGLADALNTLKAKKLDAEHNAREAQLRLNDKLERQVQERTQALEQANQRLNDLAVTDELTGAFNRRHFNDFCRTTLAREGREGGLALCMFDIDHFKPFNDRYGHQAGDLALREVAHAVSDQLRRSGDHLFRLGGEEFGILFSAVSAEAAVQFAEWQRAAILALDHAHEGSTLGVISASFGVAWWSNDERRQLTPEAMYRAADMALYAAKNAGRNRVVVRERDAWAGVQTAA